MKKFKIRRRMSPAQAALMLFGLSRDGLDTNPAECVALCDRALESDDLDDNVRSMLQRYRDVYAEGRRVRHKTGETSG